MTRVRFTGS